METGGTTQRVLRAIEARIGLIIIRTTDEEGFTNELRAALFALGHQVVEWENSRGVRQIGVEGDRLTFGAQWDASAAGTPRAVLGERLEKLSQEVAELTDDDESGGNGDGGHEASRCCPKCHYAGGARTCPDCGDQTTFSHRVLVVRGLAPFIEADSHDFEHDVVRQLWSLVHCNAALRTDTVVILPPEVKTPPELAPLCLEIEDPLPPREDLGGHMWDALVHAVEASSKRSTFFERCEVDPHDGGVRSKVADRLAGLTRIQARNAMTGALVEADTEADNPWSRFLAELSRAKEAGIKESAALEVMTPVSPDEVGGLDNLRHWIERRAVAFSPSAREGGIPLPKGLSLTGPPGNGKSLIAKTVAHVLGYPLVKFDIGAVFGSLVGESEKGVRKALDVIDAMAPAVLLIDEVDKSLGGADQAGGDSGVTSRVFGAILTWMQERDESKPVFCVLTMNRTERLPPELLRKGRVDEIFFTDLPHHEERKKIAEIHIGKINRRAGDVVLEPTSDVVERIAAACDGFVGAEIEQAIIEARINSFAAGEAMDVRHVTEAMANTKPMSVTMHEDIDRIRNWAKGRAVPASTPPPASPKAAPPKPPADDKKRKLNLKF